MLLNKQDGIIYFIQKLKEVVPYVDIVQKGQSDLILFYGRNIKKIKFLFSKDMNKEKEVKTSVWKFSPFMNQIDEYDYVVFTTSNSKFSLFDFFIIPNTKNNLKLNTKLKRETFTVKRFDNIFRCDKVDNIMQYRDAFNLLSIESGIDSNHIIYTKCIDYYDPMKLLNNVDTFNESSNLIKIMDTRYNEQYKKIIVTVESFYRLTDISKLIKL